MEVKDSLFDNVLNGNGTKDSLINALRDGTLSLSQQIKVLSDGIRLAIHETSLHLTEDEINELEKVEVDLTRATMAIYGAYKKSTCMKEITNIPRSLNCCTNIQPE